MLASLFRSFRDSVACEHQREMWRRYLLLKLLKYLVWAGALALLILNLWSAWPYYITGLPPSFEQVDWLFFFLIFLYPMVLGAMVGNVLTSAKTSALRSHTFAQVYPEAFRSAIAAGDAAVAPTVDDEQPEVAPDAMPSERALETEMFAPLAHPMRSFENAGVLYLLGVLAGLVLFAVGVWSLAMVLSLGNSPADVFPLGWAPTQFMFPAFFGICGVAVIGWALSAWRWARIERRGLVVVADEDGLIVRLAGRPQRVRRLRWADARGFARMRYVDGMARTHTLYLLITETDDMLWDEPPVSRYLSPRETAREEELRDAARRLARVVELRTGLPLRDISAIMRAVRIGAEGLDQPSATLFDHAFSIARSQGDSALATRLWLGTHPGAGEPPDYEVSRTRGAGLYLSTTPAQREDIVHFALALLPYYPTQEQTQPDPRERQRDRVKRRWRKWDDAFTRSMLLVSLLVFSASYGLSHWYAPPLLRSLPAQARAQTPINLTSFNAAAQRDWPTRAPIGGDTRSASFTSSGYQLTTRDPNQTEGAWSSLATTGDNAIELTLKLTNGGPDADVAAGGLLLEVSPDGSSALAFTIDQYGDAHFSRCHGLNTPQGACDAEIVYASSPENGHAVNIANGAVNTLLVIRRGLMYIFYVNDVPVLVYRDPTGIPGVNGYVGVYLDMGAATADFINLAVYPVPASLPFWAR